MDILEKALAMLKAYPLCDNCLGRQFAMLGYGLENDERGKALKKVLLMRAHALAVAGDEEGVKILRVLAVNGFSNLAVEILKKMGKRIPRRVMLKECFLCENRFMHMDELAEKAVKELSNYECQSFLVGVELPFEVEEREDEFRAIFNVEYGESIRIEFGRLLGKKISLLTGKPVEYKSPDVVLLINPITGDMRVQVNPLYIAGRYKKLVRGIPQSKWFCSKCWGEGCERCNWTGRMYPESVEELISTPVLQFVGGVKASFHASGREDVDARMLGKGRPFVIEVSQPKKRFINLKELEAAINEYAKGKVEVFNLFFANKSLVRKIKKAESARKRYRVIVEFEREVSDEELKLLEKKLTNVVVKQRTPMTVLHSRAYLTREKYIYEVKVKRLSPNRIEMKVLCQGGLYVKELVTGDGGRTTPSVSEILNNQAKPLDLDVLDVIMKDQGVEV
ncbi:tRNA pseudouridine(54/55) synthase Pus10 [Candidatus Bathyarchaeota archaeon]|nr:tRNA pseudouridine(54/55) synthase Pus10 [Candidatus Bathyarchaeota archaeon]